MANNWVQVRLVKLNVNCKWLDLARRRLLAGLGYVIPQPNPAPRVLLIWAKLSHVDPCSPSSMTCSCPGPDIAPGPLTFSDLSFSAAHYEQFMTHVGSGQSIASENSFSMPSLLSGPRALTGDCGSILLVLGILSSHSWRGYSNSNFVPCDVGE